MFRAVLRFTAKLEEGTEISHISCARTCLASPRIHQRSIFVKINETTLAQIITSLKFTLGVVTVLDFGHPNRCIVASHCCFTLYFPDDV